LICVDAERTEETNILYSSFSYCKYEDMAFIN
jgi:hypothetical protein